FEVDVVTEVVGAGEGRPMVEPGVLTGVARRTRMTGRRNFDLSPLIVFYEVTRACDLVCQHCRACAQPKAVPGELTTAESRRLIDQLTRFPEPPLLVITGGDPLK